MLLHVLSPALGSLIAVLVRYCTTNCIGSTFPTGFSSSWQWQFTSVWTAAHHRICLSTASRSPVLTRGGICVPPTVTYLPYRVSGSTLTAVGRSQLLARWPGTLSRILSAIQRAAQTVLGVYLEHTSLRVTSASSALGVLNDYALYKSMDSLNEACVRWVYTLAPPGEYDWTIHSAASNYYDSLFMFILSDLRVLICVLLQ